MILAILAALAIFFLYYILSPFFEEKYRARRVTDSGRFMEELTNRKEEILSAITDLEYDFKMNKMTEADYLQLKEKLTAEAIEVMKKLDSVEENKNEPAGAQPVPTGRRS